MDRRRRRSRSRSPQTHQTPQSHQTHQTHQSHRRGAEDPELSKSFQSTDRGGRRRSPSPDRSRRESDRNEKSRRYGHDDRRSPRDGEDKRVKARDERYKNGRTEDSTSYRKDSYNRKEEHSYDRDRDSTKVRVKERRDDDYQSNKARDKSPHDRSIVSRSSPPHSAVRERESSAQDPWAIDKSPWQEPVFDVTPDVIKGLHSVYDYAGPARSRSRSPNYRDRRSARPDDRDRDRSRRAGPNLLGSRFPGPRSKVNIQENITVDIDRKITGVPSYSTDRTYYPELVNLPRSRDEGQMPMFDRDEVREAIKMQSVVPEPEERRVVKIAGSSSNADSSRKNRGGRVSLDEDREGFKVELRMASYRDKSPTTYRDRSPQRVRCEVRDRLGPRISPLHEDRTGKRTSTQDHDHLPTRTSALDRDRLGPRDSNLERVRVRSRDSGLDRDRGGGRDAALDRDRLGLRDSALERDRLGLRDPALDKDRLAPRETAVRERLGPRGPFRGRPRGGRRGTAFGRDRLGPRAFALERKRMEAVERSNDRNSGNDAPRVQIEDQHQHPEHLPDFSQRPDKFTYSEWMDKPEMIPRNDLYFEHDDRDGLEINTRGRGRGRSRGRGRGRGRGFSFGFPRGRGVSRDRRPAPRSDGSRNPNDSRSPGRRVFTNYNKEIYANSGSNNTGSNNTGSKWKHDKFRETEGAAQSEKKVEPGGGT